MDSTRSKVFPVLIRSSLELARNNRRQSQDAKSATFELENSAQVGDATTPAERLLELANQTCLACRSLAHDSAEVCLVAGVITATIGALVAISGIFTLNQVS